MNFLVSEHHKGYWRVITSGFPLGWYLCLWIAQGRIEIHAVAGQADPIYLLVDALFS